MTRRRCACKWKGRSLFKSTRAEPCELSLSGPIGLSETRGSYSTASHLFGTGRMNMRIASVYGTAKR